VGQFVEFFGEGAVALTVQDRATLANMAPEYGATIGFFAIDARTIAYLRETGRASEHVALVEEYARVAGLFRDGDAPAPQYSEVIEFDLAAVEPSIAGPRRPQDRIAVSRSADAFRDQLSKRAEEGGF